ncbi:hypothetical protein [Thalassobacillus pellis]|uniref:hypothetical protein n=1 Tax=Thalassobacillus pellis TaxID=748008 RepID=UPI001EF80374|nr:hypothetical protein [Thalassobacillus pellis]MBM7552820.1 small-conductance mechanosensitive channel [Thalassobacillus pellis]
MKSRKHSLFIVVNAILGVASCFGYLYTWLTFSFMDSMLAFPPVIAFIVFLGVFYVWNKWMLRKERKKYWLQAVFSYIATILVFIYFLKL